MPKKKKRLGPRKRNQPRHAPPRSSRGIADVVPDQTDIEDVTEIREVVCHLHGIVGWEQEREIAHQLLGDETDEFDAVKIYITARRDAIYLHSNFVKEGCYHPTKISTNHPQRRLDVLVANLVGTEKDFESRYFRARLHRAMAHDFTYYIDERLVASTRERTALDLTDLQKVFVVRGAIVLAPSNGETQPNSDSVISTGVPDRPGKQKSAVHLKKLTNAIVLALTFGLILSLWTWPHQVPGLAVHERQTSIKALTSLVLLCAVLGWRAPRLRNQLWWGSGVLSLVAFIASIL